MKKILLSLVASALTCGFAFAETTFTKVTNAEQLKEGGHYVILSQPIKSGSVQYGVFAMSNPKTNNKGFETFEVEADVTAMQDSYAIDEADITVITLKTADDGKWLLMSGDKYIDGSTDKALKLTETETPVTIEISDISTVMSYGNGSSIQAVASNGSGGVKGTVTINNYKTTQKPVFLYVDESSLGADAKEAAGLAWSTNTIEVFADVLDTFEAPTLDNPNNLTVTYDSSNKDVATIDATSGVVTLTGTEGTTVISADFAGNDSYYAQKVSYTIIVKAPVVAVASVKDTKTLAQGQEFIVNYELTVGFVNSKNVFAQDANGDFIQVYGTNSYKVGDVIPTGWTGKYTLFNDNTPEIEPVGSLPAATTGTFTPAVIGADKVTDELVNSVVIINNVVFDAATPSTRTNFTGKVGDITLNFRNNYTKPEFAAGTYNVTVVAVFYQSALTLYPISYEAVEGGKKPASLAWSKSTVFVDVDFIEEFEAPTLSNPNNLTVKYSSSNETVAYVNETTGVVVLEGEEGSTIITATFDGNDEYMAQSVSYTIYVQEGATDITSVKDTKALANNTEFTVGYELTVGFVNGSNVFARDAAGDFIQVYGANSYKVGDVIPTGWTGKYKLFNDVTPEIEPVGALPAATAGTFTPAVVDADKVTTELVNNVIVINSVVFDANTPSGKVNFTGKVGDVELSFRNHYGISGVAAGTYNVRVVVTIYQGAPSLYVIEYKTESGEDPDPIVPDETKVTTLAEVFALASGTAVTIDCPLTVGFVNNKNIFVCDAAGDFVQIFGTNSYKVGDVIPAGWKATYSLYNSSVPQLAPVGNLPAATEGSFTPAVVPAADVTLALINHVITINDVVIADATPGADVTDSSAKNFTGKVGDTELSFRNNYKLESVAPGTYDITVVVNSFSNAPSLYVVKFVKHDSDGISEIEAAAGEAVYYNLQGVRIDNPAKGQIYVRVAGNKATKVVF